jgi:hypothetical protein
VAEVRRAFGLENNPDPPGGPEAELKKASAEFLADGPDAGYKGNGHESLERRAEVRHSSNYNHISCPDGWKFGGFGPPGPLKLQRSRRSSADASMSWANRFF